jgi:hypothetical protein
MNTALLVLRVIPAVLLIGHGLQKLVPARFSPPLLHANGLWATPRGSGSTRSTLASTIATTRWIRPRTS